MIEIVYATQSDLSDVYSLICALEESILDKEAFTKVFVEGLSNKYLHYLVAKEGGCVIGFVSLTTTPLLHHAANVGEIVELIVSDKVRSKGVGALLFDKVKQIAIDHECVQLEVCTNMLRRRAHKFYESKGMNKFHYRLSMPLDDRTADENRIGN